MTKLKLYALETRSHLTIVEAYSKVEAIEKSNLSKSQVIIREATEEDISYFEAMGGGIIK